MGDHLSDAGQRRPSDRSQCPRPRNRERFQSPGFRRSAAPHARGTLRPPRRQRQHVVAVPRREVLDRVHRALVARILRAVVVAEDVRPGAEPRVQDGKLAGDGAVAVAGVDDGEVDGVGRSREELREGVGQPAGHQLDLGVLREEVVGAPQVVDRLGQIEADDATRGEIVERDELGEEARRLPPEGPRLDDQGGARPSAAARRSPSSRDSRSSRTVPAWAGTRTISASPRSTGACPSRCVSGLRSDAIVAI